MAHFIEAAPDLELMAPVSLTAVCFQIKGATEADHTAVLAALIKEGTAFLGPARLDGRHGIRACVTNYRTTRNDIELILTRLSDIARRYRWRAGDTSAPTIAPEL
jgi:aromatic-L-amino-acid decarboxylase